jgi:phage nucleotide-binding protein
MTGLDITPGTDIVTEKATYLIYAAPGVGKTSTAKFFPGKTLVIDIDRTTRVLKGCQNIDVNYFNSVDAWTEWGETLKKLQGADLSKYDTIFIDNISELERCILASLGRDGNNGRIPSQKNYLQMQFYLVDSIRFLKTLGKNIVISAWETSDVWTNEDGQQYNRAYPFISQKILNNVMGLCDVVARLVYNPKTDSRGFYLQPTPSVYAKNQLDDRQFCRQEEIMKTPEEKQAKPVIVIQDDREAETG